MRQGYSFLILMAASGFSSAMEIPRPEHPEPMAVREHWSSLNGTWEFRFDAGDEGLKAEWQAPGVAGFDRNINVPFCWESSLSGIKDTSGKSKIGWYRRTFRVPESFPTDQGVWLRFGAVDWRADVWINGTKVGEHEGGYSPFEINISEFAKRDGENVVVVRAFDPTDPALPTGKQVGWYTPTSGIWQTVWLEARPIARIESFRFETKVDPPSISAAVKLTGTRAGQTYFVNITVPPEGSDWTVAGSVEAQGERAVVTLSAKVPADRAKLWSPEDPYLYSAELSLSTNQDGDVKVLDTVETYFGLREIKRGKLPGEDFERIFLNGKPVYLRLALDQSFNPEGIYTAPSDEFLRKDIELAKAMGLNGLRIHIKPDEPRRLYWADKLGLLIMEDMPNTWRQNDTARAAWEKTMRETIARDANHPSIFSWVAFNETWGLGSPERYRRDTDTQSWVKRMVAEIRTLDATRLVEDNSPCNYDHVSVTDLNSWHFYIDDAAEAKRHIEEVVVRSVPGSDFNHCPGETMNTAPLINSEYGSVSAGGGDRDVSWGFRDLTTQLRKQKKIQGYVYTELTDIEWEHNGFADYDRSLKDFGYDAFVPGMTPADLQGADFVGYDAPPVVVAKVGETVRVPVFVSHFSDRAEPPTLRWWITGVNDQGERDALEPKERAVEWKAYDVVAQSKPLAFRINGPLVGALGFELVDKEGKRIAANFVNVVIEPEAAAPRIERIDDHHVAIRFAPQEAALARWTGGFTAQEGKLSGRGAGEFAYRLKLPEAVIRAKPKGLHLHMELAAKAAREKVDWPDRVNAQDYPQTDAKRWPTSVSLSLAGQRFAGLELADDPADARGVLSHLKGWDHGSHGSIIDISTDLAEVVRARIGLGQPFELKLSVPDESKAAGGLAIFGSATGAYPFDPTLILETTDVLPEDLGVDRMSSALVDTLASRRKTLVPSADQGLEEVQLWAYTTVSPGDNWFASEFDDSAWKAGPHGFGTSGTPGIHVNTSWNTPEIWLRTRTDELPKLGENDLLTLRLFHDEDAEVYVNGHKLLNVSGYVTAYRLIELSAEQRALFQAGKNVIAVHCRQTGGGQGIDLGLQWTKAD